MSRVTCRHYENKRIDDNSIEYLKTYFNNGGPDEMNYILFSTSGVHGSYMTIEDIENEKKGGFHTLTFLIVRPRLVSMLYGNIEVEKKDILYLKKLRHKSLEAIKGIGYQD